jgi:hypothetical protein
LGPCLRNKIARKEWVLGIISKHMLTYLVFDLWKRGDEMSFSKYFSSCSLFRFFCIGVIRERGNYSNHLNPCSVFFVKQPL